MPTTIISVRALCPDRSRKMSHQNYSSSMALRTSRNRVSGRSHTRPKSKILGSGEKVSKETVQMLVSPTQSLVGEQHYEA